MSILHSLWYGKTITSYLLQLPLLPLSSIFAVIAAARRSLYANGFCQKTGPVVPVVIVGGITAGGTGKTPLTIAIVNELKGRGFKPGVLSRGYKCHAKNFPCQVPLLADFKIFGDEPCLIRRETQAPVVIDPKRIRGADYLAGLGVDVIICDDGMQHYALDREVEICVLDGTRMLGNGHLLPAGPLREAKWRLKTVDTVVVTAAVANLGYWTMMLKQSSIQPLNPNSTETLQSKSEVCGLAGIGNPDRFFKTLEDCGFRVAKRVELGDHCAISIKELKRLAATMPVVMTAKDAVKYQAVAEKEHITNVFVLNVAGQLNKQFFDDLVGKIKLSSYKVQQRAKKRAEQGYVLEQVKDIDAPTLEGKESEDKHILYAKEVKSFEQNRDTKDFSTEVTKTNEQAVKNSENSENSEKSENSESQSESESSATSEFLATESQDQNSSLVASNDATTPTDASASQDNVAKDAKLEQSTTQEVSKAKVNSQEQEASKTNQTDKAEQSETKTTSSSFSANEADDKSKPIFGKKKRKSHYDPGALPRELKRK